VLPSLEGGGAERVSLTFMRGLAPLVRQLHVIVFRRRGPLADELPDGIELHELERERLREAFWPLAMTIRKIRPDLIYATHGYVNVALVMLRPVFGSRPRLLLRDANTPSADLASQRFSLVLRPAYRYCYPRADALICQSELIRGEFSRDFHVADHRLHVLYNPTDVPTLRSRLEVKRVPGPGPRFVAAGTLTFKKGFDRLLDWFAAQRAEAHLTLLGRGPLEGALRAQSERLGVSARVTFGGFVARPWPLFAGADAFLLPSRWEGMPNAALESLACGTRVIAMAEAGGIPEVARMADPRAVTVASTGAEFVAAMQGVVPSPVDAARPSLLPRVFEAQEAERRFIERAARTLA
jgi:glycosyltransferase involved in cell wall biosynthesis